MAKIRVSITNLKSNSEKIFDTASELQKISRAVQNAANSAPSYDGQFGPKVKAIGNIMNSKGMQQSYELQDKAGDLKVRAERFENADHKSILSNARSWFNNLFGNNKLLQNMFGYLFNTNHSLASKTAVTAPPTTIELIRPYESGHDFKVNTNEIQDSSNQYTNTSDPNTICDNKDRNKILMESFISQKNQEMKDPDKKEKLLKKYNYPPEGSDAYLAFMLDYYTSEKYPIAIIKTGDNDYTILISGTDCNQGGLTNPSDWWDDENGWWNNINAFLGKRTGYEQSVLELILQTIPDRKATLHLIGHSQGGIVANNCIADLIKDGYTVPSIITFGSPPPYKYNQRTTTRTRYYAAKDDVVPKLTDIYLQTQQTAAAKLCESPFEAQRIYDKYQQKRLENELELSPIKGQEGDMGKAHNLNNSYCKDKTIRETQSVYDYDINKIELINVSEKKSYSGPWEDKDDATASWF